MNKKPLQPNKCRFCGILGTEKRPVKYGICSVCKGLRKKFPKKVECFICGRIYEMTFEEWSERGNLCAECDAYFTRKARENGYPTTIENRRIFIDRFK